VYGRRREYNRKLGRLRTGLYTRYLLGTYPHGYISFHPIPSYVHNLPPNTLMGTYSSTQYPHGYISFHPIPSWVNILPSNTLMGT